MSDGSIGSTGSTGTVSEGTANSEPLWQQILRDLERRIAEGDIVDRFPTDRELVEEYGVSRHTVRDAVQRLLARGLVERYRGRGSFVRNDTLDQPVGSLHLLYHAIEKTGATLRSEVTALDERVDPTIAAKLDVDPSTPLFHLERIRYIDDEPLGVEALWMPAELARPLLVVDFSKQWSFYDELYSRCGIRIMSGEELIEPHIPDEAARQLLGLGESEALFRIERLGRIDGRTLEVRVALVNAQRFAFTSSWDRGTTPEPVALVPRPDA